MARFTPVGRVNGITVKIKFKVKGTVVSKHGNVIDMPKAVADSIGFAMNEAGAKYIEKHIKREEASTGRLAAAIRSERNRKVQGNTLQVMLPEFLDQEVPYWRAIDQGSSRALGRRLAGVFAEGGDPSPLSFGAAFSGNRVQTFLGPRQLGRGRAAEVGRAMLEDSGFEGSDLRTFFRVKRAIKPMRYSDAIREAFKLDRNDAEKIFQDLKRDGEVRVQRK